MASWTRGHTLGRGSTATVSLAEAHRSGRVFAVKSSEIHRSEFLKREQSILSTLNSPQIVAYEGCDVTFEGGVFFYNLFMEYAPRGSIADQIHDGGLDEIVVGDFARQILLGLDYLHSNGIVHCDIKTQNVLITDEGAKIADLGCARRVTPEEDSGGVKISGTPAYMAPEVARGEKQGFPADVWALGCTVLEMITGRPPWHGVSDPVTVLYRVGFAGESPEIPEFVSEQARDFVIKCLKKDPNERWSARELLKHGFVQKDSKFVSNGFQFHNSDAKSPTSVVDRGFWDSMEESSQETQNQDPILSPTHDCRSRICGLSSSSVPPNWEECDEKWITVRENVITESNFAEANEETETSCIEDEGDLVIRFSKCCNSNDVCCNRELFLGCSLCMKIVAQENFDSPNEEMLSITFAFCSSFLSYFNLEFNA